MIIIPESILSKLSNNQRILVKALSEQPLMSQALTKLGVSNKSHVLNQGNDIKRLLASIGLEVVTTRITQQYLWSLKPLPIIELTEVIQ
jgi:hypothetical protein